MDNINFSKGIYTKGENIKTPEGFYKDAMNMRKHGQSLKSEEGTKQISGVPTGIVQWGSCSIGDETIVLGSHNGKSIIGSIGINDTWTLLVPARAGVDILGINEPCQVEGRKIWSGDRIIYFSTSKGARRINLDDSLPTDDVEFDKVTSLFLEYDLPKTSYINEDTTGSVPSGVYQFAARLVTESGASTSFGLMSNVIPVVPDSLSGPRESVNGAPPQTPTSKSVNIKISNVDTAFRFLEIAVLTYEGLSNTPKVYRLNRVAISDRREITYQYQGSFDHAGELLLEELVTSSVAYTTGKFFAQKDDSLLIGAPTESNTPDINWFNVAKRIQAQYTVKEVPYVESLEFDRNGNDVDLNVYHDNTILRETSSHDMDQGYKNPVTCTLYKGYRRGEVYSFTLTPVFVSGVLGPTVHIPAMHAIDTEAEVAGDVGDMGTFISEEKYPDDRYGTDWEGKGLRLHKFPDAITQPLIQGDTETGDCRIRILGIKFSNIYLDPTDLQYADQIKGFIIGRVDRRGNETQLAQGIARGNRMVQFQNNGSYAMTVGIGDGYMDWFLDTAAGGTATQSKPVGSDILNSFTFLAPDLIHNTYQPTDATGIKQHSVYKARPFLATPTPESGDVLWSHEYSAKTSGTREGLSRDAFHSFYFFKNIYGSNFVPGLDTSVTQLSGESLKVNGLGVPMEPQSRGGKNEFRIPLGSEVIRMCSTRGFVWYKTQNSVDINYHKDFPYYYKSRQSVNSNAYGVGYDKGAPITTEAVFVLHTLVRENPRQYGPLDNMVSMYVDYFDWDGTDMEIDCFNGDTFISKYGLNISDEGPYVYPSSADGDGDSQILKPATANGIVYFWLESDNNYNYRHYESTGIFSEEEISEQGTMPFYPEYKTLANSEPPFGLFTMHAENWELPGYANQYNTQYSSQPTTKPYSITPPEDIETKASLVNRVIYSVPSIQGEKNDAYQMFLPNNYYDVPQEYGDLTDLYVNRELFASTAQVQWKLFFNTLASQITSAGEVVLGTGGAFNRPATPLQTVEGGYGGTAHWLHAVNTPQGRVFIDQRQGRIFQLRDTLAGLPDVLSDDIQNSIWNSHVTEIKIGSEPLHDRVIMVLGHNSAGPNTWSYDLVENVFVSRHTFNPHRFFTHGAYLYSNNISADQGVEYGIFKHSHGDAAKYYGTVKESFVTLIANMGPKISKHFKALEVITRKINQNNSVNPNIPFETFDQLYVWNDERASGLIDIVLGTSIYDEAGIGETLAEKVKDAFRLTVPRDVVKDPNSNVLFTTNHKTLESELEYLPKMRGNYILIKLITKNTKGPIIFSGLSVSISENIR